MRILKWFGFILVGLIVILGLFAVFNLDRLKRLNAVNTLFSEDNIVKNFSNMSLAFETVSVPNEGDVEDWQVNQKSLPETFQIADATKSVADWMTETKTTSLLVVQDGSIAHEEYFLGTGAEDLRISWSIAKSFLSAAFGVAVSEGKISLDENVEKYVPALLGSAYEGAKVRHVLNMASGVKFNEDYLDFWSDINRMGRLLAIGGSMDEFAADVDDSLREPGEKWKYTSIDTHVLAMVLRAATGKTLGGYLGEKIVSPIGFQQQPYYLTDSYANAFALGGLNITTRDYARFGQMFLNKGVWNGQQIVPADWVAESIAASAPPAAEPPAEYAYGYQWWVPRLANGNASQTESMARGIYGQYIYINHVTRTVIVKTSAHRKFRAPQSDGTTVHANTLEMFRAISVEMGN